jgi:hypothetical protein
MQLRWLGVAVTLGVIAGSAAASPITVNVNGQPVDFPYAQPTEVAGRVMIPLRGVLEQLGANRIAWRPQWQEVDVAGPQGNIRLRIGDRTAIVAGREVPLDVPPMVLQNTTMVPLRFVSETLGARVDWNDPEQTVYIVTPGQRVAGSREQLPAEERRPRYGEEGQTAPRRIERGEPGSFLRSRSLASLSPRPGARVDDPRSEIFVRFQPDASIDLNTVHLSLNDRNVTPDAEITRQGVRYLPLRDLPQGENHVRLSFRDSRGVLTEQEWNFYAP